jgi:outer membrane protein OmpA-like peptidoglycan-associated protein
MISVAALVYGCSSTPDRVPMLEQAQANYNTAASDPQVVQHAQPELSKASKALEQARQLHTTAGADKELIPHFVYLAERHTEIAKKQAQAKMAEQTVANASEERSKLVLSAKNQQTASASAKATAAEARTKELEQKLSDLNAKQTSRGLVLTLPDVLFDVGRATLKSGTHRAIDNLAQVMKENSDINVRVEGFTDSTGSEETNRELSQQRADAVRMALVERGIEQNRITSRGFGESLPVASNKTPFGRQANRRVEIVVSSAQQAR